VFLARLVHPASRSPDNRSLVSKDRRNRANVDNQGNQDSKDSRGCQGCR
jgi:hypothetical protein